MKPPLRTYSKRDTTASKSYDALNALFAQNLFKKNKLGLEERKKDCKIKELPSPDPVRLLHDSSSLVVNKNDTFDRLFFNHGRRSSSQRKSLFKRTLDRTVDESLFIEKVPAKSNLTDSLHLTCDINLSYKNQDTSKLIENRSTVPCSTPYAPIRTRTRLNISPINGKLNYDDESLLQESYQQIERWNVSPPNFSTEVVKKGKRKVRKCGGKNPKRRTLKVVLNNIKMKTDRHCSRGEMQMDELVVRVTRLDDSFLARQINGNKKTLNVPLDVFESFVQSISGKISFEASDVSTDNMSDNNSSASLKDSQTRALNVSDGKITRRRYQTRSTSRESDCKILRTRVVDLSKNNAVSLTKKRRNSCSMLLDELNVKSTSRTCRRTNSQVLALEDKNSRTSKGRRSQNCKSLDRDVSKKNKFASSTASDLSAGTTNNNSLATDNSQIYMVLRRRTLKLSDGEWKFKRKHKTLPKISTKLQITEKSSTNGNITDSVEDDSDDDQDYSNSLFSKVSILSGREKEYLNKLSEYQLETSESDSENYSKDVAESCDNYHNETEIEFVNKTSPPSSSKASLLQSLFEESSGKSSCYTATTSSDGHDSLNFVQIKNVTSDNQKRYLQITNCRIDLTDDNSSDMEYSGEHVTEDKSSVAKLIRSMMEKTHDGRSILQLTNLSENVALKKDENDVICVETEHNYVVPSTVTTRRGRLKNSPLDRVELPSTSFAVNRNQSTVSSLNGTPARKFIQPGKTWRKSIRIHRRNSLVLGALNPSIGLRESIRYVPTSAVDKSPRRTLMQSYAENFRGYAPEDVQRPVESLFEELSVGNDKSVSRLGDANTTPPLSDPVSAKDVVLRRCGQKAPIPFSTCYPESVLKNCHKIGEGVYGEVFLFRNRSGGTTVMKVIPIEGEIKVNGEPQKLFSEILSEIIIAMELSDLRAKGKNSTCCFNLVHAVRCVKGRYPARLLDLWDMYDESRSSDNDRPDIFGDHQLYIVLELANGGKDLESFRFNNAAQAYYLFQQVAISLAVAEVTYQFEHRDLHWGNMLVTDVDRNAMVTFHLNGREFRVPSEGVQLSIIDYTLSRITFESVCIYNDLALDPDLFNAEGDYQFDIYRLMKKNNNNNWQHFEPYTNILWLHYVLDKMIEALRYKYLNTKVHKLYIDKLKDMRDSILRYKSAEDFVTNTANQWN